MTDPRLHYIAAVTPFLIAASVVGLARLRSDLRTPTAAFVLVLCASFSAIIGAWPGAAANASPAGRAGPTKAHVHALDAAVALVPADAAVSATNDVGSHLSARREFYSVPVVGGADWIVVDTTDPVLWHASGSVLVFSPDRAKLRAFTARIERSSSWVPVYAEKACSFFGRRPLRDAECRPAVAPLLLGVSPLGRPVAWALSHPATIVVWSAMVAWSVLLGSLVRSRILELSPRALRPWEHDASRVEHRTRPLPRGHERNDRRADGSSRSARRSDPRPPCAALAPLVEPARACVHPGRRGRARRAPSVSGSLVAISRPNDSRACSRWCISHTRTSPGTRSTRCIR